MNTRFDHTAIVVADMDKSMQFYCEGIGLTVVSDQRFHADQRVPFNVAADILHAIHLAHAEDVNVALLELVEFEDGVVRAEVQPPAPPYRGPWLISFECDVSRTVDRLSALGYVPRVFSFPQREPTSGQPADVLPTPLELAVVEGPDGELVELFPPSAPAASVRLRAHGSIAMV